MKNYYINLDEKPSVSLKKSKNSPLLNADIPEFYAGDEEEFSLNFINNTGNYASVPSGSNVEIFLGSTRKGPSGGVYDLTFTGTSYEVAYDKKASEILEILSGSGIQSVYGRDGSFSLKFSSSVIGSVDIKKTQPECYVYSSGSGTDFVYNIHPRPYGYTGSVMTSVSSSYSLDLNTKEAVNAVGQVSVPVLFQIKLNGVVVCQKEGILKNDYVTSETINLASPVELPDYISRAEFYSQEFVRMADFAGMTFVQDPGVGFTFLCPENFNVGFSGDHLNFSIGGLDTAFRGNYAIFNSYVTAKDIRILNDATGFRAKISYPDTAVSDVDFVLPTVGGTLARKEDTVLSSSYAVDSGSWNTRINSVSSSVAQISSSISVTSVANTIAKRASDATLAAAGINLDIAASPTTVEGSIRYNNTEKCVEYVSSNGVVIQVGQEQTIRARNSTGGTLANGTPVYVNGATGNRPTIQKADADALITSQTLIGLVTETAGISNNSDGHVTTFGLVRELNTSAWAEGDILYLSDGTSGTLTNVKPTTLSSYIVRVGFVTISHISQGVILVAPQVMGSVFGESLINSTTRDAARLVIGAASSSLETRYNTDSGSFLSNINSRVPTGSYTIDSGSWNTRINSFSSSISSSIKSYVDPVAINHQISSFLCSDGITTNRGISYTGGARQSFAAVPTGSFIGEVFFPSVNPANNIELISAGPSISNNSGSAWSTTFRLLTDGSVSLRVNGASSADAKIFSTNTSFRSDYQGYRRVEIILTNGETNPTIRVDNNDVSSRFSLTYGTNGAGTSPAWLASGSNWSNLILDSGLTSGSANTWTPVIGALSSAERNDFYNFGRLPAWVHFGGSAVNATGDATLTNDSAWIDCTGNFVVSAGSIVGTSVPQFGYIGALLASGGRILNAGAKVRYKVVVSALSGGNSFAFQQGSNGAFIASITTTGTYQGTYTATTNDSSTVAFVIKNLSATPSSITITSVEWYVEGAVTLQGIQNINVVRDLTTHGGNQGRLIGFSPYSTCTCPSNTVERPVEAYTGGTSVQLLGGAITGMKKRRILSVSGTTSSNTTLSLGSSTGAGTFVNNGVVNGDFDISTFTTRIVPVNSSLWVTFNGNTSASINIQLTDL